MVDLKFICNEMERFGMINFHRFKHSWQNTAQSIYVWFQTFLITVHVLAHLYSTLTRATRYPPEFFQTFLEDCIIFLVMYSVYMYHNRKDKILDLTYRMEKFSTADMDIVRRCMRQSKWIYRTFVTIVFLAIIGSFLETTLPISDSELRIRRHVYRTKHPERRLPYPLRIPFMDETETGVYTFLYVMDMYVLFYFTFWVSLMLSQLIIVVIHIRGQYMIMCKYIRKIGTVHMNKQGERIVYTNIESDEYIIKVKTPKPHKRKLVGLFKRLTRQTSYEQKYLRQIIQFHVRLLAFQDKFMEFLGPNMAGHIFGNNVMISLCCYQMFVSPAEISKLRYFKFIAEFVALFMAYFIFCTSSEMADECHGLVRTALVHSSWEKACTNQTKRDLCILVRRVQRPNHLRFYNGALVITRRFFLNVVKVSFNFVNFMRIQRTPNPL